MKHSWSEVFRFGDEDLTKIFNLGNLFFYLFRFGVEDVERKTNSCTQTNVIENQCYLQRFG